MIEPPEPPHHWLDGNVCLIRAIAILIAAALAGLAIGATHAAWRHQSAPEVHRGK